MHWIKCYRVLSKVFQTASKRDVKRPYGVITAVSYGLLAALSITLSGCAGLQPVAQPEASPNAAPTKPVKLEPVISPEARALYDQALAALKAGRYTDAERGLLAVIQREPNLAGPHANLGIAYARMNRPAQAIASLQQATKLNPERAAYHNELGVLFRQEGKFDDALRHYTKALEADANYAYAHLNIGILYDLYLQQPAKAVPHYERYRDIVPSEAAAVAKWLADIQQRGRKQAKGG